MDKVDPERILAELEAARLAARARRPRQTRRAVLVLLAFLILAIGAVALWILATTFERMPRPMEENIRRVGMLEPLSFPVSVFPKILLCPARSNFLTSPSVISGLA
jgi:hypothetical protein